MRSFILKLPAGKDYLELFAGDRSTGGTSDGKVITEAKFEGLRDIDTVLDGLYREDFPEGGERFYTVDTEGNLRIVHICGSISLRRYNNS